MPASDAPNPDVTRWGLLLEGSWVAINGVRSTLDKVKTNYTYGYPTYNPLKSIHEPPNRVYG